MPPSDDAPNDISSSSRRPLRTTLYVWLSVLAVVAVMTILFGTLIAWLIIETAPSEP